MAVPKYYEMYHSFLQSLSDGEEHPYSDVKKKVMPLRFIAKAFLMH